MTTPQGGDPVAALAIEVAALRGLLTLAEERFADQVRDLEATIDEAIASTPKGPPAVLWASLADDEASVMARDLRTWLADFLREWYPMYVADLPECLMDHPEARIELSNLAAEFARIYTPDHPPLADAINLHERVFPGIIFRLKGITRGCAAGSCAERSRRAARGKIPP